jgi:membrane protease YdiL (CAAX protease family)
MGPGAIAEALWGLAPVVRIACQRLEALTGTALDPVPPSWRRLALAAAALTVFDIAAAVLVLGAGAALPRFDPLWLRATIIAFAYVGANVCALVAAYQIAFVGRRRALRTIGVAPVRRVASTVAIYIPVLIVVTVIAVAITHAIGLDRGTTAIDTVDRPLRYRIVIAILAVLVAPWIEEAAMRGLLLGALWSRFGFWIGAVGSGLAWASIHLTPSVLIVFTAEGVLLAWVRRRTGSILTGVGLHGAQNTFATAVDGGGWAPVPVAGLLLVTIIAANRFVRTIPA